MRSLHRSWQDKRPGWTRRIRWYSPGHPGQGIRLSLEDEYGMVNIYPADSIEAQALFDRFKLNQLSTLEILTKEDVL